MSVDPLHLVIDANILVAAFFKAATTRNLLLDPRLKLFSPSDLLIESQNVLSDRLAEKWQAIPGFDFDDLFNALTSHIQVIPKEDYLTCINQALEIAQHPEDAPYLALSLHFEIPLWSNDGGMKNQSSVKVFSTTDLLKELGK